MAKLLTAADILAAEDQEIKEVAVPEWGGSVFVRSMNGNERDRYEKQFMEWRLKKGKLTSMRASMLVLCLCDETGKRIFTQRQIDDLGTKSSRVLDRLWDVARDLSGMDDDDVEELAGNSDETDDEDSISD